jgi:hypothetical protein
LPRTNHHTSTAAAFAVGAELSRRGYDVAFTRGNSPRIDLLATVPDGPSFKVQVKGISKAWGFFVQESFFRAPLQTDLFLVIVLVAREPREEGCLPFRFFVLSHSDAKHEGGKMVIPFERGLNWGSVAAYEDSWGKFPKVPAPAD